MCLCALLTTLMLSPMWMLVPSVLLLQLSCLAELFPAVWPVNWALRCLAIECWGERRSLGQRMLMTPVPMPTRSLHSQTKQLTPSLLKIVVLPLSVYLGLSPSPVLPDLLRTSVSQPHQQRCSA